ncbi:MAG: tetratricopeptide repeat protein [Thermodesulfobacteriota bacterium]
MDHPFRGRSSAPVYLAALATAVAAAYRPALSAPFLYDDFRDILQNGSIRSLSPLSQALFPPTQAGTAGRPLSNLLLALCYAFFGENPEGYHLVVLLLHMGCTALVFFLVRKSLGKAPAPGPGMGRENLFAAFSAGVFGLHPLAANSAALSFRLPDVLAASLALSALLLSIRSLEKKGAKLAPLAAGLCFTAAVSAKQDAVMLPLLFLAWQWVFAGMGPGKALKASPPLLAGFAAGLALLAAEMAHSGSLGRASALSPYSPISYALSQPEALFLYLRRAVWPGSLVFDYRLAQTGMPKAAFYLLAAAALFLASLLATARRKAAGFWALWFFVWLLPSSSLVPLSDLASENRTYLAMAGPAVLFCLSVAFSCQKFFRKRAALSFAAVCLSAALALGFSTRHRVEILSDPVALWKDTVRKRPENAQAFFALATAQARAGDAQEAEQSFRRALSLAPDLAPAHNNLGALLLSSGKISEALAHLSRSLRLRPESAQAENSLGWALYKAGKSVESLSHLRRAVMLAPDFTDARVNLAVCLWQSGRPREALGHLERAQGERPGDAYVSELLEAVRKDAEKSGG